MQSTFLRSVSDFARNEIDRRRTRHAVSLRANTQNRGDDGVVPPSPRFCRLVCHSSLGGVSLVRRAALMPLAVIVKTPTNYRA